MAVLLNGTNGLIQAYDYQAPATGFSYLFAAGTQTLVLNPAGTLATGTITMPASPSDGMTITFSSTQQITALTLNGNTGQTVVGAPSQLIPNQPLSYIYRSTGATWYAMAGGAGNASSVVIGTSVASTSGTSIDFTGIPSWARRVTVMFNVVSTNGSSIVQIQIGSGSVSTTGYTSAAGYTYSTSGSLSASSTTGFALAGNADASLVFSGAVVLTLLGSNTWTSSGVLTNSVSTPTVSASSGVSPALGGALDRVRITTIGGTNTFDAGTINISYE